MLKEHAMSRDARSPPWRTGVIFLLKNAPASRLPSQTPTASPRRRPSLYIKSAWFSSRLWFQIEEASLYGKYIYVFREHTRDTCLRCIFLMKIKSRLIFSDSEHASIVPNSKNLDMINTSRLAQDSKLFLNLPEAVYEPKHRKILPR